MGRRDARLVESVLPSPASPPSIVMYWRPGCGFCSRLRAGLQHLGLPVVEIDIWQDPDAAAFVRSVANGCETVPTVTVGGTSMVNPSPDQVLAAVRAAGAGRADDESARTASA